MNAPLSKCKQILQFCFRRPFSCKAHIVILLFCYVLSEFSMHISVVPTSKAAALFFGLLYSFVFTGICLCLPRMAGMVVFAISNFAITTWALVQIIYYGLFNRLMWTSDTAFASDGVIFIDDVLDFYAPPLWWILVGLWAITYLMILLHWPPKKVSARFRRKIWMGTLLSLLALFAAENSSLVNEYDTMHGAIPAYYSNGFYHLLKEDIKTNWLDPLLPGYEKKQNTYRNQIDSYFYEQTKHQTNEMTGVAEGKNVIVILMESLDDWMITPDQMPTVSTMMDEGIVFTDFYTPFYGTTRSINTEVCINTGVYFPTNGSYFYDYLDNSFFHSLPNTLRKYGYSSQVFHHNYPDYYRRTELIPAIGYDAYQSYIAESGQAEVLNDSYPFDSAAMRQQFFREGLTFNMLITQAAHMPYNYGDSMSIYAIERHPEYYGAYGSEEEDCIRAKARLIDDTIARLLDELEHEGALEDTLIVALSDHYPYGYSNTQQLLDYAGGTDLLSLDNTPCFIWSAGITPLTVRKTLNTSDLFPTILNLLGIEPEYNYLGRDAFDPGYEGYAFFPDGSWVCNGVMCKMNVGSSDCEVTIIDNKYNVPVSQEWIRKTTELSRQFTAISNMILLSDYYHS